MAISLFAFAAVVATRAADGDLDTTYGTSGVSSVSFGASDLVYSARLQADGKMLVVGGVRPGSAEDFGVARFTAEGAADVSFGTSGIFSANLATHATTTSDRATGVGVQSDGKIILSGYARTASAGNDFTVIRLTSSGVRDMSFNNNTGVAQADFYATSDNAASVVVQSDDKIIVAGSTLNSGVSTLTMVRFNADGTTDTSFGTSGKVALVIGSNQTTPAVMVIDASGKILIGGITSGSAFALPSNYYAMLVRLNSDGTRDTSFGTNGVVNFNTAGSTSDSLLGIALQADGKIVACGYSYGGASNGWVARFTSTGSFDTSFNTSGVTLMDFGSTSDQLYGLVLQPDGKVVAGGTYLSGSTFDSVLVRLTSSGSLDTTFAGSGINKLSLNASNDKVKGIGLQSSTKIVVALEVGATGSDDFAVARLLNTPSNTAPTISNVADQATSQNVATSAIAFTIGDTETAAASLTVTGSSSNTALVSNSNIVFGGSGASRTVTITPTTGQVGTTTITLTVTDAGSLTATDTFVLTVSDTTAPTVTSVLRLTPSAQIITAGPVVFRVTYSEAVTNVTSANFAVEAVNGGNITGSITNVSGSGATRDVTVSLTGGAGEFRLNVTN